MFNLTNSPRLVVPKWVFKRTVVPLPSQVNFGLLRRLGTYQGHRIPEYSKFVNIVSAGQQFLVVNNIIFEITG